MAAGLLLNVIAEKGCGYQRSFIYNSTPSLTCTIEIHHGLHPVVLQFPSKRPVDQVTAMQLLNDCDPFRPVVAKGISVFLFLHA
jgi:hypothetical protein